MKKEIIVPSLGESISEATIGQLFASSGSIVKMDGEILELETDKVNQVLYAPLGGKIELSIKSGDTVKIGQVIGSIEEILAGKEEKKEVKAVETTSSPSAPSPLPEMKVKPTPPVSKGESLRYTKESFLNELDAPLVSPTESIPLLRGERETSRPMSRIRKVISQRLVEAQQTMAMLTTFNEVDMTSVMELREKYKEIFLKKYGAKLGFMSFFVKAVTSALKAFPEVNSYIDGENIVQRNYVDIGVAVGTDKGVIVPVVRNCDNITFAGIEKEIEGYAKKAREGKLAVADLQGGGFTITNGGVYGSLLSTPIMIPPQCAILGMHKIEKRPVVIQDQIVIRSMMYLALSYDHRLIDGKEAVSFLVHVKNMLEDPARLALEI